MDILMLKFLGIVYPFFLIATVRYATQMFQQNSYRVERYNRWLRQTGE